MEPAEAIESVLSDPALARVADELRALVRPAIRLDFLDRDINPTDDREIPAGASKLGGLPDLPNSIEWPTVTLDIAPPTPRLFEVASRPNAHIKLPPTDGKVALEFIAQIRLSELRGILTDSPLADSGFLFFFFCEQVFNSDGGDAPPTAYFSQNNEERIPLRSYRVSYHPLGSRIFFVAGETIPLARRPAPSVLPEEYVYPSYPVRFSPTLSLPGVETCFIGEPGSPQSVIPLAEEEWSAYSDRRAEKIPNWDHLLGYSQDSQPYAMETSYQNFRAALFPELPAWEMLTEEEKQAEFRGCTLLLQVEPKEYPMHFGRGGALYFFIRQQDLARHDFSRAWAWVQ